MDHPAYQVGTALVAAAAAAVVVVRTGFVRFRRRLRAYIERTGDIEWRRDTTGGGVCAVLGYELELDLLGTFAYRVRRRADEPTLFAELAGELRGKVPPVSPPPFPLVRDRIFPLLKRAASLPVPHGYAPENRIVRHPLDDDVCVAYVIEGQHTFTYVTEGMLPVWGVGGDALHELALSNLRTRTSHILDEIGGRRAEYVSLDGFDAARALVAEMIIPAGIDPPLLAIPHEHACLIAGASDRARLSARAQEMFATARIPLTPRLYRLTPGGLRPEVRWEPTGENADRRPQNAEGGTQEG